MKSPAALAAGLPELAINRYLGVRRARGTYERFGKEHEAQHLFGVLVQPESQKELRILQAGPLLKREWENLKTLVLRQRRGASSGERKIGFLMSMAPILIQGGFTLYLTIQAAHGQIRVGDLIVSVAAVGAVYNGLKSAGFSMREMTEFSEYALELRGFLGAASATGRAIVQQPPFALRTGLEVRQVSFRYPGAEQWALENVSFRLRAGESVAVVGDNGCGKTTLAKIMATLYRPTEGSVLADGVDVRSGRLQSAAMFQDFIRFQRSLRENVALGNQALLNADAHLLEALQTVGLRERLNSLPQGLDTRLGHTFPGGVELSGGEWQRVALARVYLARADLVVLDEPTAALDPRTEVQVIQAFLQFTARRTALIISHRLGVARLVDKVLMLKAGKLVEEGSHDELIALGGEYARMWEAQAQWYRDLPVHAKVTIPKAKGE
ncbi:MAG: ABC transporter ATP-binding protein [Bacillota bacterium]